MSGVAIILAKLKAHAPLAAVVPTARMEAGDLPLKTILPAISVVQVSSTERWTVDMAASPVLTQDRVQVTVLAKTYPQLRQALRLVRQACPQTRGVLQVSDTVSFTVDSILPDVEGPDFFDADVAFAGGTRDFLVTWAAS